MKHRKKNNLKFDGGRAMATNTTGAITNAQLHENYIRLSKLVHPDLNPDDPDANLKFQELNAQYIKAQEILDKKQTHYQTSVSIFQPV